MLCINCGSNNAPSNRYCGQCGARMTEVVAPVQQETFEPSHSVSSEFRYDVERQQRALRQFKAQTTDSQTPEDAEAASEIKPGTLSPSFASISQGAMTDPYYEPESAFRDQAVVENAEENSDGMVPDHRYHGQEPISGPSFLGLGNDNPDGSDLNYLYEDDPSPGRARYWVAAMIVVAFAAFVVYEWKQNPNWQTTSVGRGVGQLTAGINRALDKARTSTPAAPDNSPASQPTDAVASPPATANPSDSTPTAPTISVENGATPQTGDSKAKPESNAGTPSTADLDPGARTTAPSSDAPKNANRAAGQDAAADSSDLQSEEPGSPGTRSGSTKGSPVSADVLNQAKAGKQPPVAESAKKAATASAEADQSATDDEQPEKTPVTAASRTSKAATARYSDQQSQEALVAKADAYLYGRGVPKSCQQALVYLRTAANHGNAAARSKLGGLYATGHCVPLDRAEAYNWFTLARDAGSTSPWIVRNREMLWAQMTPTERARANSLNH